MGTGTTLTRRRLWMAKRDWSATEYAAYMGTASKPADRSIVECSRAAQGAGFPPGHEERRQPRLRRFRRTACERSDATAGCVRRWFAVERGT